MVLTDSCFAVSMNEQVFTTITSASSALAVRCAPPACRRPIMTSLSTRFLGHPRLTKPTFSVASLSADSSCWGATVRVSTGMRYIILASENTRALVTRVAMGERGTREGGRLCYTLLVRYNVRRKLASAWTNELCAMKG